MGGGDQPAPPEDKDDDDDSDDDDDDSDDDDDYDLDGVKTFGSDYDIYPPAKVRIVIEMMIILTLAIFIYPEVGIMMRCSEVKSVVEILRSCRTSRLVQLETKTIMMA